MVDEVQVVKAGITFGNALAMVISWSRKRSLLWVIVHGVLSWLYVVYYALFQHGHQPAGPVARR